ncbi:MAG TPA: sulfotransferase [Steroidobacteraceae bacterium]|nr:sulfotransferase [Steroidobacteraceae bacterium]
MTRSSPVDPAAYRLMRQGRIAEALPLAERAVEQAAICLPGHAFLASILLKLGRVGDAERVVDRAAELSTGTAEAYEGLAYLSTELGRHERANALYRRATELEPQRPRSWYNLACSERSFGRLTSAEAACDRAIALDRGQYPSLLLRSELAVQSSQSNHVEDLERRLADPRLDVHGRIFLGYALAKELDDLQRFDAAFGRFAAAAKARRAQLDYDVAGDERRLRRIVEVFSGRGSPRADRPAQGAPSDIFVVGLPRSGTTLVERLLTGLAGVRSNGETDNFSRALAAAAAQMPVPTGASAAAASADMIERAAAADPAAVAAHYAGLARRDTAAGSIVEKLPTNYLYIGAIRRALPAARIIMVRRSPLDSCFAMFRALFGDAYPFSYDFEELARYYAAYDTLMNHWLSLCGAAVHEVVYEELVREPQRIGAELASYCGLAWRPEAAAIEGNSSVSLTASAVQVRRPIYGSSSGRWRHYRNHLAPLIAALRRRGAALPEDA